jgi:hypothetical protein
MSIFREWSEAMRLYKSAKEHGWLENWRSSGDVLSRTDRERVRRQVASEALTEIFDDLNEKGESSNEK